MISVDKSVLRELKKYDSKLYIKWNNRNQHFEVWRTMPWGDRLITPVVRRIYGGRDASFCPLDMRIMGWLYSADTARKGLRKNWKWMRKQNMAEEEARIRRDTQRTFLGIAKDNYNLVNAEVNGLVTNVGQRTDSWSKPDNMHGSMQSDCPGIEQVGPRQNRVGTRTTRNIKEIYGEDE